MEEKKKSKSVNSADKIVEDSFSESISAAAESFVDTVPQPKVQPKPKAAPAKKPVDEMAVAAKKAAEEKARKEATIKAEKEAARREAAAQKKREAAEARKEAADAKKKEDAEKKRQELIAKKEAELAQMKADAVTAKKQPEGLIGQTVEETESAPPKQFKPKAVMNQTAAERMKDKAAKAEDPRSVAAKQAKLKASPVGKAKVNETNSGLKLLYQPVFEPARNMLIGFECLLRIYDVELGILTPAMFLEVAQKDVKLIKRLEDWSIEEVLKASKKLREQNVSILSVNISTKHFFDADFVETTSRIIEKTEIKPYNIYFEMSEEVLFGPYVEVINKFASLRALGIKIAIDNFGASYFNADSSKPDFVLDMVKIPFGLVKKFMNDRKAKSLIRIIIAHAKQKKTDVIALGVETKQQEEALLKMGVRKMQGYLYSKPLATHKLNKKNNALK